MQTKLKYFLTIKPNFFVVVDDMRTAENLFKCQVCGKKYSTKGNLKAHTKVHYWSEAHNCQVCQKAFKSAQELVVHNRKHTGEKPFKCPVCGRGFSQKGNLSSHVKNVHIGHRNFRCPVCQKCFKTKQQLDQHLVRHDDPKLECVKCGRKFHFIACLKIHINKCVFKN